MSHKKQVVLALSAFAVVSLACSFFSTGTGSFSTPAYGQTSDQGGQESPSTPEATLPVTPEVSDQPNLILYAFLIESTPIGNGMKRVNIGFYGKNDSSLWWTYRLTSGFGGEGSQCLWGFGASFGNNFQATRPSLATKEGYTYSAVVSQDSNCGPRITWDVPPGVTFGGIGQTYEQGSDWWGKVQFDIPEPATPVTITLPYGSWAWSDFTQNYDGGMVTADVKPVSDFKQITDPFDRRYAEYLKINKPGDEIKFGDLATMTIQTQAKRPDGSFPISMRITSLDQGYPLDFKMALAGNSTFLIYQDGTFCCQLGSYEWGWGAGQTTVLGPLQSVDLQALVPNPMGLKVWLVGEFTLQEQNAGSAEESKQFIIELTN